MDTSTVNSSEISMPEDATFANMQKATLTGTTAGVTIEDIDVLSPLSMKFRYHSDISMPQRYNQIDTDPEEISDLFIVLHYALG